MTDEWHKVSPRNQASMLQNARWTIMRHGAYVFGIASVAADIVDLASGDTGGVGLN